MYRRLVDDTICITDNYCKTQLLKDLNDFDPTAKLKFTYEPAFEKMEKKK